VRRRTLSLGVFKLILLSRAYLYDAYYTIVTHTGRKYKKPRIDLKAIGRRMRQIRGFDLTQAEFGRMLGIGQTQLSRYELGLSLPTTEVLLKLKACSGKSIDWILTGEGPKADE
jgi:DNA-binding transcriptional regulator YiaG